MVEYLHWDDYNLDNYTVSQALCMTEGSSDGLAGQLFKNQDGGTSHSNKVSDHQSDPEVPAGVINLCDV